MEFFQNIRQNLFNTSANQPQQGQESTFLQRLQDPRFLGLLSAAAAIPKVGTAEGLAKGAQVFNMFSAAEEERKRKELMQQLVSEGGFTEREKALIAATPSQNQAAVIQQINARKAAANKPNIFQQRQAIGTEQGLTGNDLQTFVLTGNLPKPTEEKLTTFEQRQAIGTEQGLTGEDLRNFILTGNLPKPTEEKQRRIETDLSGRKRFTDTGELVFPDVPVPDEITDTTDFKNFKELQKDNPNLTFEQYMRSKTPIQSKGVYKNRETGDIIGEVNFDPYDGTYFQYDPETEQKNIIDIRKFSPMTDATFAKTIPNFAQFTKNFEELNTDRASMKRLSEYMTTVNNTNEGLLRLADQFSASAKTLLGGFFKRAFDIDDYTTLSKAEINSRLAQGRLQGLIGRFRIETVGGGVMTEQDALRIIANLGGDVNLLQNKEIVAQQLASLYEDKANSLNRKVKLHNNAVRQVYSESGYEPIDEVEIDNSIFTPDRSLLETEETTSTNVRNFSDEELQDIIDKAIAAGTQPDLSKLSGADLDRYIQLIQ